MVPSYEELMLPVLKLTAIKPWPVKDLVNQIADDLHLSEDDRSTPIASGRSTRISNRVYWAKTYLKQAGLVQQPRRAVVEISPRGKELLATSPLSVDNATLRRYPEFLEFLSRSRQNTNNPSSSNEEAAQLQVVRPEQVLDASSSSTPDEQIELAAQTLLEELRDALLARILESPPAFFERLIIDLLLAMGYGGSRADAADRLGGTGDGGVDGVIREDQLGLDRIYLQAKRYKPDNVVGSETVQAFIGALYGKGAQKGVIITTSSFSRQAKAVASQAGALRIVLIDGPELARLMVRFDVGVRTARTIDLKRIDLDYFEDSEVD